VLLSLYTASGIAKAQGDWLTRRDVLWTQLHDSYQTSVAVLIGNVLPAWAWVVFQGVTLVFETFALLWFTLRSTRPVALIVGLGMHTLIGLMFGPVIWFSLLMNVLLVGCFAPPRLLGVRPARA
jgi:hypothetical protein